MCRPLGNVVAKMVGQKPNSNLSMTSSLFPQISSRLLNPHRPNVNSVSHKIPLTTSSIPWVPDIARPYMYGRPTTRNQYRIQLRINNLHKTAWAPKAIAFKISEPRLIPESNRIVNLPASWAFRILESPQI